jgi:UTP--glucose-1-phosphate uridylyltransferase
MKNNQKITKAVITSGGFGSRLLPVTAGICKEMLPLLDTPFIHHIVKQCIDAGVYDIVIVCKEENLGAIQGYFTPNPKLISYLSEKNKLNLISSLTEIQEKATFTYVLQDETLPYGNARPLVSAKHLLLGGAFIYSYGDDLIYGKDLNCGMQELVDTYNSTDCDLVLMCKEVEDEKVSKVGIVALKEDGVQIERIVEKPSLKEAPSNLASVASYVFTPQIFDYLNPNDDFGTVGEFYIQKGIDIITHSGKTLACKTKGEYLTCGDPLSYLKATIRVAQDIPELKEYLDTLSKKEIEKARELFFV